MDARASVAALAAPSSTHSTSTLPQTQQVSRNISGAIASLDRGPRIARFTEKLVQHGFYKDNSLTTSTNKSIRSIAMNKNRPVQLVHKNEVIDSDLEFILSVQARIQQQQQQMDAEIALYHATRKVQNWYRLKRSQKMLHILKISRFVRQRWRFFVYFKIRKRKASFLAKKYRSYRIYLAFKLLLAKSLGVRRLQRLWRKYQFRLLCKRLTAISRLALSNIPHCSYFGLRRAIVKIVSGYLSDNERRLGAMIIKLWKARFRRKRLQLLHSGEGKVLFYQLLEYHVDLESLPETAVLPAQLIQVVASNDRSSPTALPGVDADSGSRSPTTPRNSGRATGSIALSATTPRRTRIQRERDATVNSAGGTGSRSTFIHHNEGVGTSATVVTLSTPTISSNSIIEFIRCKLRADAKSKLMMAAQILSAIPYRKQSIRRETSFHRPTLSGIPHALTLPPRDESNHFNKEIFSKFRYLETHAAVTSPPPSATDSLNATGKFAELVASLAVTNESGAVPRREIATPKYTSLIC
jgi:RNase P/RNase MRP subunit POP5